MNKKIYSVTHYTAVKKSNIRTISFASVINYQNIERKSDGLVSQSINTKKPSDLIIADKQNTEIHKHEETIVNQTLDKSSNIENPETVNNICDTIFLINGEYISVKVHEIGTQLIKFNFCGGENKKYSAVKISEIKCIKFANGELWNAPEKKPRKKIEALTLTAFLMSITGIFAFGFILSPIAIVLAYYGQARIKKNPEKYEGKGLATLAIILSIIIILLIMLKFSGVLP